MSRSSSMDGSSPTPSPTHSPGSSPGKEKKKGGSGSSMSPSSSMKRSSPRKEIKIKEPSIEVMSLYGVDHLILKSGRGVASVTVCLYGGQVRSWITEYGEELLFTSTKAFLGPPEPVRGGIPICFPQYANNGTLENHGFARKKIWAIDKDPPPLPKETEGRVFTDLLLKLPKEECTWPHVFEFRLRVSLASDGHLTMVPRIRNVDDKPFSFTIAFHTYLIVSDVSEVRVEGLETYDYLDNLQNNKRFTQQGDALTFESEVDRVYLDTSCRVAVMDHSKKQTILIEKEGLPDVVVWNPWAKKAKELKDLEKNEYQGMVCVDGAAIENPIKLKPGQEWTGQLKFTLVRST